MLKLTYSSVLTISLFLSSCMTWSNDSASHQDRNKDPTSLTESIEFKPYLKLRNLPTHHSLYASAEKATNSTNIRETIKNWRVVLNVVLGEQDSWQEYEFEDVTHYMVVRHGLLELMRAYYLSGEATKGDEVLRVSSNLYRLSPRTERNWKYLCGENEEF